MAQEFTFNPFTGELDATGDVSGAVTSVNGQTGAVTVTKTDVGLGNVDNTSDANKPVSSATQTALDAKVTGPASAVDSNIAEYNGTTGKIIKDGGLTHAGVNTAVSNSHASGSDAETTTTIGALINGATVKTTPVDADFIGLMDSAASNILKKLSWANIKATLKTYFDTLYGNNTSVINFIIDGGGVAISTGIAGDITVPFGCTINSVTLLADQSGSIVVDIWKDTYANYPPTVADTITASAKPTISATTKATDATLTGWTTSITSGDTLRYNVDSITTITRCLVSLKVTKT